MNADDFSPLTQALAAMLAKASPNERKNWLVRLPVIYAKAIYNVSVRKKSRWNGIHQA